MMVSFPLRSRLPTPSLVFFFGTRAAEKEMCQSLEVEKEFAEEMPEMPRIGL